MSGLDDRMTFDMVKYRVESAPYITIARIMTALGCGDSNLKVLLKKAYGITVVPGDNPLIYYIVTEETMKQIAQDMKYVRSPDEGGPLLPHSSDAYLEWEKKQRLAHEVYNRQLLGLKVGSSPWMSLDGQRCKDDFEAKFRNYNENA